MSDRRSYLPAKDLRPPLGTQKQEAAKFLRDMATDFLKERSGENVVTEAVREWLRLVEVPNPLAIADKQLADLVREAFVKGQRWFCTKCYSIGPCPDDCGVALPGERR